MSTGQGTLPAGATVAPQAPWSGRAPARRQWVLLVTVLLACAALRGGMAWQAEGIARDGHTYIRMARQWWHDPGGVIHKYPYHPGYPAAVATVHAVLSLADTPRDWRVAGVLVSGAASILAMLGAWLWGRMVFGWRTACAATLLFGMGRKWGSLGADVLSDSLALCPMIWSLVVGVWATQAMRERPGRGAMLLALSGVLGGAGYCVRPEAAAVPCLVVAMLVGDQLLRGSWRRGLLAVGVAIAAVAAVAVPYMLLIGDVTKKKRLLDMLNPAGLLAALPEGLGTLVQQLFEAMHPVLGVLLIVWLVACVVRLWRPAKDGDVSLRPAAPTGVWMLIVLVCWTMMMVSLKRTAGYMSYRHVMFLAIVLSPLAGQGLVVLAGALRTALGRERLAAAPLAVVTLILGVGVAAHALHDPLYRGIGAYQAAGAELEALARPGDGIVADARSMEFELLDIQKELELRGVQQNWRVVRVQTGLSPQDLSAAMDRERAAWAVIQSPREARESRAWLADIGESGLSDLAGWPIIGSPNEVHLYSRRAAHPAATAPASQTVPVP